MEAVKDELIRKIGRSLRWNDFYFAGGCIYSLWNDRPVKDYDIFFTNKRAAKRIIKYFKRNGRYNFWSDKTITFGKYQFVVAHVGKAEKVVSEFDFKHNLYWYDQNGVHALESWDYIGSNQLVFNSNRARDILNTVTRVPKFVKRGMEISQGEMDKMLEVGTSFGNVISERKYIKNRMNGRSRY